ncbi:MAG: SDR family NAD(P)-dependent oxidoreductase, partial [Sphingobacteriales bacterium]
MQMKTWDLSFNVNVTGAMLCTQAFGQQMLKAGKGAIVNVASIAGSKAADSTPLPKDRHKKGPQ